MLLPQQLVGAGHLWDGEKLENCGGDYLFHARYAAQPWLVEGGAHIDTWQIRRRTLDAVGNGSGQLVASIRSLQHQRTATVALSDSETD